MDFICFAVLILFMFEVEESTECNTDDIAAFTGCNVSLKWTLQNVPNEVLKFNIYNSLENLTASYSLGHDCRVRDNSSTSCQTIHSDDVFIILLTIFNVTESQSGIYSLQQMDEFEIQRSIFTNLTLIGKPKVITVQKPILGQRFEMTCSSSHGQECYTYRWRINGTMMSSVHNVNSLYVSSLRTTDNFYSVTCQVCLNETANTLRGVICEHDHCSLDSDPYSIQVAYGPDNISLSRRERTFYLKEHEIFKIDCYANCYPNCIFWWKGPSDIPSKKLDISFELRMSGQYTCHVTNQETNITIISDPITLHHAKEDVRQEQDWTGPVVVSVFLTICGILVLVTVWRQNTIRTIEIVEDSRGLFQPFVGQTVKEVSGKELERTSRLLHVPAMQVRLSRKTRRLECPENPQKEHFGQNLKSDPYNTIDEDALSDYNHRIDNVMNENSHETRRSNEHAFYDYAHSIEMCHVETVDEHETDETYITPISDIVRSLEVFQDEKTDVLETDHAYLTVIDDSVNPIEICQVEEIDVKETDETYITPINGSESGSANY